MSALPPPEHKVAYVEQMFSRIAPGYDRMNRLMTFGLDQSWRARAVAAVAPPAGGRALDLGCGTGDLLADLAAWLPDGLAVGVDYTRPMLHAGLPKLAQRAPLAALVAGDALVLPFADASFDAITTGFMMRNVADIGVAFREMLRVARPGAVLACLEVARPRQPLLRLGHRLYFEHAVPLLARLLGADTRAYSYLPQSARGFPPPATLAHMLREAGWQDVSYALLGLGAVAIHTARKPAAQ